LASIAAASYLPGGVQSTIATTPADADSIVTAVRPSNWEGAMRNPDRSLALRLGRGLLFAIGFMAALALIDAVLLFFVLLLAAMFSETSNPYIGIVFIGLPILALLGAAVAAIAYAVLTERAPGSPAGRDHVHV
jgi:hypothetical protein